MGRPNILPEDVNKPIKLRMERLKWVDGDYDQWGAYWGGGNSHMGNNIYCAWLDDVRVFVRASDRKTAKEKVKQSIPGATFFR